MSGLTRDSFQPSGLNSSFNYTGNSFAGYVEHMRHIIEKARIDLDKENHEIIIDANSPYEWLPEATKMNQKYPKGMLLIHGLFDSPCCMQSLAEYFHKQGYLVRTLLLPGHGTVPGDLLKITYHDWLKATQFAISCMVRDVKNFFIAGFSTGAALAIHAAIHSQYENLRGLLLFSPAIKLMTQYALIFNVNNLISRTVGGLNWFTKIESNDYAKYQSFTFNSAHQVGLLARANQLALQKYAFNIPYFMVMTADDEALDIKASLEFFRHQGQRRAGIIYGQIKSQLNIPHLEQRKSTYLEKQILNFSHVCIPIAPNHFHYGEKGDFSDFNHYANPLWKRYRKRLSQQEREITYFGAVKRANLKQYHLQRLTYNPDFDYMMEQIQHFMDRI